MKRIPLLLLLVTCAATAEEGDAEWLALVQPTSSLEIGLGYFDHASPSASNRLGTGTTGNSLVGGFDLRGDATYDSAAAHRWHLAGNRLGLDSQELSGEYAEQGRFRLRFEHDRLPRFLASENYHTPFLGAGGTALILPAGFPVANPQAGMAQVNAAFQPFDIDTLRKRTSLHGSLWITPEWEFKAEFREDRQTGTRATGATMGTGGNSIAMILPEPIDTVTRRFESSLGYQNQGTYLQFAYQGSFFSNDIGSWTFQNPFSITNTLLLNRMGSAPDNQAHQFSISGGYPFARGTRLTGSLAYGRLIQDDNFLPYSTANNLSPYGSLDGLVVTKRLNLKLASRLLHNLRLNTTYKFDSRDNRTPVEHLVLPGVSSAQLGEVGAANAEVTSTPYSRRKSQGGIEAIYTVRPGSDLTVAAQHENTARYCNGHPDCVEVGHARENSWRVEWRQNFTPEIIAHLGYANADRKGDDYQKYAESIELAGMRKFFLADRRRDQWRGSLNASLTNMTSLGMSFDLNQDDYRRSPYGLESTRSHAFNLDLSHSFHDDFSISLFGGREVFRSALASSYDASAATGNVTDVNPDAEWQAMMHDTVDSAGLSLRRKELLGGRLELSADLVYIRARAQYRIAGGNASSANNAPQPLPDVTSRSTELRLNARIAIDEHAALRFAYLYRRLASADFALDLYSNAALSRLLGTQENAPRFDAHVFTISYLYRFR